MAADEASARVWLDAKADPRLLCDEYGKLLPMHLWPDDLANSVEAVEFDEDGAVRHVRFVSKAAARRTILEVSGPHQEPGGVEVAEKLTLVNLLAASWDTHLGTSKSEG